MVAEVGRALGYFGVIAALSLAVFALAACGSPGEPAATAEPTEADAATQPSATVAGESTSGSTTAEPEPQGEVAPKFTLPSAAGESVSLESFAGNKNVVLVFYRGFW